MGIKSSRKIPWKTAMFIIANFQMIIIKRKMLLLLSINTKALFFVKRLKSVEKYAILI